MPWPAVPATCFARMPSAPSAVTPLNRSDSAALAPHRLAQSPLYLVRIAHTPLLNSAIVAGDRILSNPLRGPPLQPGIPRAPVADAPVALRPPTTSRLSHRSPPSAASPHPCRPPRCARRRHTPPPPRRPCGLRPSLASAPRCPPVSAPLPSAPSALTATQWSRRVLIPSDRHPSRLRSLARPPRFVHRQDGRVRASFFYAVPGCYIPACAPLAASGGTAALTPSTSLRSLRPTFSSRVCSFRLPSTCARHRHGPPATARVAEDPLRASPAPLGDTGLPPSFGPVRPPPSPSPVRASPCSVSSLLRTTLPAPPATCFARLPSAPSAVTSTQSPLPVTRPCRTRCTVSPLQPGILRASDR